MWYHFSRRKERQATEKRETEKLAAAEEKAKAAGLFTKREESSTKSKAPTETPQAKAEQQQEAAADCTLQDVPGQPLRVSNEDSDATVSTLPFFDDLHAVLYTLFATGILLCFLPQRL